jgi:hypothetical protein
MIRDLQSKSSASESQESIVFEKYRTAEVARIEELRESQIKELRREKGVWERNRRAQEILPNKREKLEISILKQKVEEIREEMKAKDVKNGLAAERMRKKIEGLFKGSKELEGELKISEGERVALSDECNVLKVWPISLTLG